MEWAQLLAAQAEVALKAPVTRSSGWTDRWSCCVRLPASSASRRACTPTMSWPPPATTCASTTTRSSRAPTTTRLCVAPEAGRGRRAPLLTEPLQRLAGWVVAGGTAPRFPLKRVEPDEVATTGAGEPGG
jgi:hypothetical protein